LLQQFTGFFIVRFIFLPLFLFFEQYREC